MTAKNNSYSELKSQLDEIILQMQDENLDIDKSAKLYEEGLKTIKLLEEHLKNSENKIKEIKANFENSKE